MLYHLPCLVTRDARKPSIENNEDVGIGQMLSDLEIIDVVNWALKFSEDTVICMNDIQATYLDILCENAVEIVGGKRYKPYLKKVILESIKNVHFNKLSGVTKSEQVFSTSATRCVLSASAKAGSGKDLQILMDAAKIIRREIKDSPTMEIYRHV